MAKKPTIREVSDRVNLITNQLNFCSRMLESIGVAFSEYIKFSGDEGDFKKHLENNQNLHKLSKEEKNAREKGHMEENNDVPTKKVRKKKNGKV